MSDNEFHSDITPMEPEEFLSILAVLTHDWEGEEKGDWEHKLLDQCLFLEDKIEWLEKQLQSTAKKARKREGRIKFLEKKLNIGFHE